MNREEFQKIEKNNFHWCLYQFVVLSTPYDSMYFLPVIHDKAISGGKFLYGIGFRGQTIVVDFGSVTFATKKGYEHYIILIERAL